ncbi:winged helix-turn-helix domain-containing protein [Bifidobacterium catulorum]|uniref:OmpR/PhoB-type domain-containing protein n=1 Tax=Bifidobacterium catulorum TaxID=1630173 RepID=A0A2U2MVC6_9BIFI|nr:winged helix-turn-helix domain-containing protein [Bifidobacterium catulorum]PWG60794.1 hypothetical protein DF200_00765 [Bifidobacterium catulorum]
MDIILAAGSPALRDALGDTLRRAHHTVIAFPVPADEEPPDDVRADLVIIDDGFPFQSHPDQWNIVLRNMQTAPTMMLRSPALGRAGTRSPLPSELASVHAGILLDKPFSDAQLLAYVRMVREHGTGHGPLLARGGLVLDTESKQAFYGDDTPIALSPREYAALLALIEADGSYLSFEELLERVCGRGVFEQRDIMTTVMYRLIRKMRRVGLFITKHGDSYRIG